MQCRNCGKSFNLLTQQHFDQRTGFCRYCLEVHQRRQAVQVAQQQQVLRQKTEALRAAFHQLISSSGGILTDKHILQMHTLAKTLALNPQQAFQMIHADALLHVQQFFGFRKERCATDPKWEHHLMCLERWLFLTAEEMAPLWNDLQRIKTLAAIRSGDIPAVRTSIALPSSEICYWDAKATYHKELTRQVKYLHGQLVFTDAKARFVSQDGGFEFPLSKIASVQYIQPEGINLQLTRNQGKGYYQTGNAEILAEVIQVLIHRHNRTKIYENEGEHRVPQEIKTAVYQRDGGRCVQCGAQDYLEYDHIIPFSKGGATSINNIQILCRRCNGKKSNKI